MTAQKATFGERSSDFIASGMGSWKFIIIQTGIVILWMTLNSIGFAFHWDVFPYILLNLLFSTQAAYAAPIIMMSQNRQAIKDRLKADIDYDTNRKAEKDILKLHERLDEAKFEVLHDHLEQIKEKLGIPLSPDDTK